MYKQFSLYLFSAILALTFLSSEASEEANPRSENLASPLVPTRKPDNCILEKFLQGGNRPILHHGSTEKLA